MEEKEMKEKKNKALMIIKTAKKYLDDPDLDENMTIGEFCSAINTNEQEYMEALKISERGKVLILEREVKERYINNYNPEML